MLLWPHLVLCWRASWGLSLEGNVSRGAATGLVLRSAEVIHLGSDSSRAKGKADPLAFVLVLL